MKNFEENDFQQVDPLLLEHKTAEYQERFSQAMKILEVGGIHPKHNDAIKNPYLPDNSPEDTEDFSNVGRHCIAVATIAEKFHPSATERALVHDANKR